ncbi:hypothetical protein RRG08_044227 [Elysia crispata]|uniref:Uncharacterized protein n=1 Tax=Elysia crispata TaxID=231223 RepID=A0AAE0XWX8_9GAST|nr:hypothetical protein RRG08_044227 [Elysia crispata]
MKYADIPGAGSSSRPTPAAGHGQPRLTHASSAYRAVMENVHYDVMRRGGDLFTLGRQPLGEFGGFEHSSEVIIHPRSDWADRLSGTTGEVSLSPGVCRRHLSDLKAESRRIWPH